LRDGLPLKPGGPPRMHKLLSLPFQQQVACSDALLLLSASVPARKETSYQWRLLCRSPDVSCKSFLRQAASCFHSEATAASCSHLWSLPLLPVTGYRLSVIGYLFLVFVLAPDTVFFCADAVTGASA